MSDSKMQRDSKEKKDSITGAGKIAFIGMFTAIAMVFSYIESMIPVSISVPGVKLGLANMVTIVAMYKMKPKDAWYISIVRVFLSSLLFGNMTVLIYSLAGAFTSLILMTLCMKLKLFGIPGTSVVGAVGHNAGQIAVAAFMMKSGSIMLYMPVLCISGVIAGICIGIAATVVTRNLHFGCF